MTDDWSDKGIENFRHRNLGYVKFCQALDDGRLTAGENITQSELSDMLGISLSPLRETLVLLEEYGLVEVKQRSGIKVFYPEVSFIRENMQYRAMIETYAMPVLVRNVTDEWIAQMRSGHLDLRQEWEATTPDRSNGLPSKSRHLDRVFHAGIVEPMGNEAIRAAHKRVGHNVQLARKVHMTSFRKTHYLDTITEHMRVLDAVEAGDTAEAITALEAHFRLATHRLFIDP